MLRPCDCLTDKCALIFRPFPKKYILCGSSCSVVNCQKEWFCSKINISIIKNIQCWRLSDCNNHIVVKSFGGANCSDMEDYLKPVTRKEPERIILHIGTNDLSKNTSPDQIAQGIINLGIQINQNFPQTKITTSDTLPRTDKSNLLAKANQVNSIVRKYCDRHKWGSTNHKSINETCLNARGLHLNKKGTALIAKSISSYITNY